MAGSRTTRTPPAASRRNEAPPIVHALGGSIGSALALLLFYPLERARIEMQSKAADTSSSDSNVTPTGLVNEEEISPIRCSNDGDSNNLIIEEASWDRAGDSPTSASWSMNSCSIDDDNDDANSVSSSEFADEDFDSSKEGILRCLLDLRDRGVLYKGVKPIISTIFTSQFVFFFLHAYAKSWLLRVAPASTKSSSPWLSLMSSCLAGVGNVLLTNPLWVTNMAIISGTTETQNLFRELRLLWKERGPRQLWTGTDASLLLVSNPIIQFVCYEQFKRIRLASKAKQRQRTRRPVNKAIDTGTLGPAEAFVIAALAKAIATVSTYPLQLSQTLLRLSSNNSRRRRSNDDEDVDCDNEEVNSSELQRQQYKGTMDCLIQLYRKNDAGCAAWFTGMKAKLLQTVLTAAFTFLTYEQILGVVKQVALRTMRIRQNRIGGRHQKET